MKDTQQHEYRLTEEELRNRKSFMQLGEDDERRLREAGECLGSEVGKLAHDVFVEHIATYSDPAALFGDLQREGRLESVLSKVGGAVEQQLGGRIDFEYAESRLQIGRVHAQIGLEPKWYLGALSLIQNRLMAALAEREPYKNDPPKLVATYASMTKVANFDATVVLDAYTEHSLGRVVRAQQDALRELAAPVIEVWDQILVLPLIGTMDTKRAQEVTESLLESVDQRRAKVAIIDITGLPVMDTSTAEHLFKTVRAVELLGTTAVITGVRPAIAQTVVSLGIDASALRTQARLADGLRLALELTGKHVTSNRNPEEAAGAVMERVSSRSNGTTEL